ncbi:hypothetical protein [Spirillospora sp. NPDC048824]|uniref:hypothetical protein n=1 Tax=Spirillospora sp. NPDC048824 TaxID=3364526 RepID=UPI003710C88B
MTPGAIELLVAAGADVNTRLDDPPALWEAPTADTPLGIARELNSYFGHVVAVIRRPVRKGT